MGAYQEIWVGPDYCIETTSFVSWYWILNEQVEQFLTGRGAESFAKMTSTQIKGGFDKWPLLIVETD